MFEQAFKNIDDILWKDDGVDNELDYTEQTSWILFLKYLNDLERDKKLKAELENKKYKYIIDKSYHWEAWAAPKNAKGEIGHNNAMTGSDLIEFVEDLFKYMKGFKAKAGSADTIEYKIGEISSEIKNELKSDYSLREIFDIVDELHFRSSEEKHELSYLYETRIKNMGNTGRNGGQYYTPRPLTIKPVVTKKKMSMPFWISNRNVIENNWKNTVL